MWAACGMAFTLTMLRAPNRVKGSLGLCTRISADSKIRAKIIMSYVKPTRPPRSKFRFHLLGMVHPLGCSTRPDSLPYQSPRDDRTPTTHDEAGGPYDQVLLNAEI